MSGHMVNFEANHALRNYQMFLTRTDNPEQVKIYACSCRYVKKRDAKESYQWKGSYAYNEPGSQIWAYIVTNDFDVMKVREAHVFEALHDSGFQEITPELLSELAEKTYEHQRWPA